MKMSWAEKVNKKIIEDYFRKDKLPFLFNIEQGEDAGYTYVVDGSGHFTYRVKTQDIIFNIKADKDIKVDWEDIIKKRKELVELQNGILTPYIGRKKKYVYDIGEMKTSVQKKYVDLFGKNIQLFVNKDKRYNIWVYDKDNCEFLGFILGIHS